jgi:hypothetical protein
MRIRFSSVVLRALRCIIGLVLIPLAANAQSPSTRDLLRQLAREANHPADSRAAIGVFGCGLSDTDLNNESVANSLVAIGESAIPDIEEALQDLQAAGRQSKFSPNSQLLLLAYAHIRKSVAYFRLHEMAATPNLNYIAPGLEHAIAASLDLTSYVSNGSAAAKVSLCRAEEPRDPLNLLVRAWERGERLLLEQSLGPTASAALSRLLQVKSWNDLRAELWPGSKEPDRMAIGFRFQIPGAWSAPDDVLNKRQPAYEPAGAVDGFELITTFTRGSGTVCGTRQIRFIPIRQRFTTSYLVDNSDIANILRMISMCLSE